MSTARRRGNSEGSNPVQRADGRWQINLRYRDEHGIPRRITLSGKTAREARDKADEVRRRLRSHLPAKDRKIILAAFTESWITSTLAASDRKPSTKSLYATLARKHIIEATIGAQPLDKLKPSHVEAWKVELKGRGLSDATIRRTFSALRAILDTAVRDEALARNPAAAVKAPKVSPQEAAYLTPDQVRQLLEAARTSRYAKLFEFLVNTGLRRGEALALRWSDVDLDVGVIRVRGTLGRVDGALVVTEPKTAKSRRSVPLSTAAERVLRDVRAAQAAERLKAGSMWQQTGLVFTTEFGTACEPRNALRALQDTAKHAKLPTIGLHTLRHSAAAVMLVNGVPLKVVSEVLGHASIGITGDIYGHVSPDVSRDALRRLSEALG
jgi:integrase